MKAPGGSSGHPLCGKYANKSTYLRGGRAKSARFRCTSTRTSRAEKMFSKKCRIVVVPVAEAVVRRHCQGSSGSLIFACGYPWGLSWRLSLRGASLFKTPHALGEPSARRIIIPDASREPPRCSDPNNLNGMFQDSGTWFHV